MSRLQLLGPSRRPALTTAATIVLLAAAFALGDGRDEELVGEHERALRRYGIEGEGEA